MGSGEADAYHVKVSDKTTPLSTSITTAGWTDNWGVWHPYENVPYTSPNTTVYWNSDSSYPRTVYYYQIKCPKPGCKRLNWCELDKTVTCKGCGSTLKAVSETVDYEIPIEK